MTPNDFILIRHMKRSDFHKPRAGVSWLLPCHQALSMASWTRSLRQWGKRFIIGSVTLFLCSNTHSQQRPCLGQSDFGQEQYSFIFVLTGHSILLFSISIPPVKYLWGQLPYILRKWNYKRVYFWGGRWYQRPFFAALQSREFENQEVYSCQIFMKNCECA